jgi:hypothetical protein
MGLIKKIDVQKYFAARRAANLLAARTVSYSDVTGAAEIPPLGATSNASELVADFSSCISPSAASPAPAK